MRATLALLRKDLWWLLGFLLLGSAVTTAAMFSVGYEQLFLQPIVATYDLSPWLFPCAFLFGVFATTRENLARTSDFLCHRPIGASRISWTRAVGCFVIVASWPAIGFALLYLKECFFYLHEGHFRFFSNEGNSWYRANQVDPGNLALLAEATALAEGGLAVGVITVTLPVGWKARIPLVLATFIGYQTLSACFAGLVWPASTASALFDALVAVGLLAAAAIGEQWGRDRDRPPSKQALCAGAPLPILGALTLAWIAATCWEGAALEAIEVARPDVWRVSAEELALVRQMEGSQDFEILDISSLPTERRLRFDPTRPSVLAPRPSLSSLARPRMQFPPVVADSLALTQSRTVRLKRSSGQLDVLDEYGSVWHHWMIPNPLGTSFSDEAFFTWGAEEPGTWPPSRDSHHQDIVLVEPAAKACWRLREGVPPVLVPEPFPERTVRIRTTSSPRPDGVRVYAMHGINEPWSSTGSEAVTASEASERERLSVSLIDPDPLRPEIEVSSADGLVLRHRYELMSTYEEAMAGMAKAATLFLPVPVALLAVLFPREPLGPALNPDRYVDRLPWILDPMLGRYTWLLGPNIALSVVFAIPAFFVLHRRGASRRRALGWALAVFMCGVFTWLVLLAFETRRAWRRFAPAQPAAPRIEAA